MEKPHTDQYMQRHRCGELRAHLLTELMNHTRVTMPTTANSWTDRKGVDPACRRRVAWVEEEARCSEAAGSREHSSLKTV